MSFNTLLFLTFIFFSFINCIGQFALANPAPAAKIQGLLLNAESMYRDLDSGTVDLAGNIQLVFNQQHLTADKAHINLKDKSIEAEGNIQFITPLSTIGAQKIFINYETGIGTIYGGYVESGPVIFEGEIINKTGEKEYLTSRAEYTACTTCPPGWAFSGSSIKAELGGYAHIKHAVLKFGGVPVLWLPYLIVPLKSDRQSGLLIPSIDFSESGGLAISQSFFWAMSRSTDSTWTLKNYEYRGLKGQGNYRYLLSKTSQGELDFALIRDRVFSQESRLNKFRAPNVQSARVNRWFLRYNHYYDMPNNYVQRANLNLASDLQYPRDFPNETKNHGDAAMENRISLTKNTERTHFLFDSSYFVNMLQTNPLAGNDTAVHRLPEIRFSQAQKPIFDTDWMYSFDTEYVNFARASSGYDDLTEVVDGNGNKSRFVSNNKNSPLCERDADCNFTRDGFYDPDKDLIRTGQRFDFKPMVYKSFRLGEFADIAPKVTYRETHYNFNVGQEPINIRRFIRTEVSARTTLSQVFGQEGAIGKSRYKHEIEPEITATQIPWFEQKAHPFFGNKSETPFFSRENISDSDLLGGYGIQYDYNDRVYDRNLVTFSIANKLTEKAWIKNLPTYKQVATLKISQSYDAYQASLQKEPWSDISTILDLRFDRIQSYTLLNYFPYKNVTNTSSRVRFNNDYGSFFQVALVRNFTISPTEPVNYSSRTEDYTFSGGTSLRYLNLLGQFVYDNNWENSAAKRKVKSWAYIAEIKPPGDCWSISFIHDQVTGGDTNFRLNFSFIFDGKNRTDFNSSQLDSFGF